MYEDSDVGRGERIASLRGDRLMTQATLATAAGLHVGTVRRAESGRPLSVETAQALCAVFGLPPHGLGTTTGAPAPVAPVTAGVPVPNDAGIGPPRPRVHGWLAWAKWSGIAVAVLMALGAVVLEGAAWMAPDAFWFRLLQAGTQTCAAAALGIACLNRFASTRRKAWGIAIALTVAACAWPSVQIRSGLDQTALDVMQAFKDYSRENAVIRIRAVLDPTWDASEARWKMTRQFVGRLGSTVAYLETPGTYAWHERRSKDCRELFLHAEAYPRDVCDPVRRPILDSRIRTLWKSVVGGTFVPYESLAATADEVIGGEGFAEARSSYDAHTVLGEQGYLLWTPGDDFLRAEARARAQARSDGAALARATGSHPGTD